MALLYALATEARFAFVRERTATPRSGHAQMLPWREPVRPWCYKLESGAYIAALYVDAPDGEERDGDALGRDDAQLSKGIREITPDCAAWIRTRYVAQKGYDKPRSYPNELGLAGWLLDFFDEKRAEVFDGKRTFKSKRVVWIGWMPPSEKAQQVAQKAQSGGGDKPKTPLEREDANIAEFDKKLRAIAEYFKAAGADVERVGNIQLLDGGSGEQRWYSLLASELAWAAGHEKRRFRLPDAALQDGAGLVAAPSYRGGYDLRIGRREFAFIVVKAFPKKLWPRKLKFLKRLGVEYETVVRFLPWSEDEALKEANAARSDWLLNVSAESGGDDYMSEKVSQTAVIKDVIRRGEARFGEASVYIVLSSLSRAAVNDAAGKVVPLLDREGIKSFVATVTAEADYLAGLPGITDYAVRKFPLHTLNTVHLANLHRESTGRRWTDGPMPPCTPALTQAISDENEIVRIHWNHDPMDVFDHARVGARGSGKSVQIAHEALSFVTKMPMAGVTLFDNGRSSYRVTNFLDGVFYDLLGRNTPGFALYRDVDTAEDRGSLVGILQSIVELQKVPMTVQRDDALERALNSVLSEDPDFRSHSLFCEVLQDAEGSMKKALAKWTRGNPVVGNVLDRERDTFDDDFRRWTVIEQSRILQPNFPAMYRIPLIATIYWKARKQIRRMKEQLNRYDLYWLFEQDEAHSMLEDEQGCRFIKEMTRMARREQLVLGLSSQRMSHFTASPAWPDIKEEVQAWEYFGNSALLQEETGRHDGPTLRQQYAETGLPDRGIGLVATCPRFHFVYRTKTGELKRARMEYDAATLAIIARTRQADNARVDEFMARHPNTWRWELLKYEGVPARDIARLRELYDAYRESSQAFAEAERTA